MGPKWSTRNATPAMSGEEASARSATSGVEAGRSYWERHAKAYGRSLALLGRALPRVIERARDAARGAGEVLEVGAGTGAFTTSIATEVQRLIATDYSEAMVALLRERLTKERASNVECTRADLYSLPFETSRFDVVLAANVLHLVPDLPGALREMRRVLAPGGKLIAPTFCHDETTASWIMSRLIALTGFPGRRRFTSASLRGELERAGLRIGRHETVPGLIPIGYADGVFDAVSDERFEAKARLA